jgi:hypothetical protein
LPKQQWNKEINDALSERILMLYNYFTDKIDNAAINSLNSQSLYSYVQVQHHASELVV